MLITCSFLERRVYRQVIPEMSMYDAIWLMNSTWFAACTWPLWDSVGVLNVFDLSLKDIFLNLNPGLVSRTVFLLYTIEEFNFVPIYRFSDDPKVGLDYKLELVIKFLLA